MNSIVPKIAVLLAAYNGEKWLEQQLHSILCQIGVVVNIFISVDASNDATFAVCQKAQATDPRVFVLPSGQRFGSAGRNFYRLIKDVDIDGFDYVAFADQDDIWLEDKLLNSHNKILSHNVDCYSCDVFAYLSDGRKELIKKSFSQRKYDQFFEAGGPGCTYVMKASVFSRIKVFVLENYADVLKVESHDWLIYAFSRQVGIKWLIDDAPKMLYRQHDANVIGANNSIKSFIKRFQCVKGGWYRRQVGEIITLTKSEAVLNINDRLFLIKNFRQLRRRPRDQFVLLLFIMLGVF